MEQHMVQEGDSTAHSHSNSAHEHVTTAVDTSSNKVMSGKMQHGHSYSREHKDNKRDTIIRQDSMQTKKKKELKDMKY